MRLLDASSLHALPDAQLMIVAEGVCPLCESELTTLGECPQHDIRYVIEATSWGAKFEAWSGNECYPRRLARGRV